jgi:Ca-activated chloride channel family protein
LLDAVALGVTELERAGEPGRMRAVVLLTDGQENDSRATLAGTQAALAGAGITVFAIAYGEDADLAALQQLAGSKGLAVSASVRDIEEIYKALSAHV